MDAFGLFFQKSAPVTFFDLLQASLMQTNEWRKIYRTNLQSRLVQKT